jgi:hypothetical protein
MPDHIDDIPIDELQIFDGDELIFDGSDPSTYIVLEPGTGVAELIAALGWDRAPEGADDATKTGSDIDPAPQMNRSAIVRRRHKPHSEATGAIVSAHRWLSAY